MVALFPSSSVKAMGDRIMAGTFVPPTRTQRLWVGLLGSGLSVAAPITNRIVSGVMSEVPGAWVFELGTIVPLSFAFALSVVITTWIEEDHIMKCVLTSIGIPGFAVSLVTIAQIAR